MIRSRYLLVPIVLALATCVAEATDISGTISSDAEWTLAGAPYHLVGNTTIASGATVTVRPGVEVIVMTAHASIETAVAAMKEGAADYLAKPFDKEELLVVVANFVADLLYGVVDPRVKYG